MEFSDVIRRRRSVRSYSDRTPDPELIAAIVDRARRAPTAGFSQGIDFLVIDDPSAIAEFWELTDDPDEPTAEEEKATRPPVVVVVWSDPMHYLARAAGAIRRSGRPPDVRSGRPWLPQRGRTTERIDPDPETRNAGRIAPPQRLDGRQRKMRR